MSHEIVFTEKVSRELLKICNSILGNLIQYSENNERIQAVSKDPIFIHSEYIYDLPEYNLNMLKKIISNLYTEFIIIEDEPLHLVYLKGGDAKETRFIQSFITINESD